MFLTVLFEQSPTHSELMLWGFIEIHDSSDEQEPLYCGGKTLIQVPDK